MRQPATLRELRANNEPEHVGMVRAKRRKLPTSYDDLQATL